MCQFIWWWRRELDLHCWSLQVNAAYFSMPMAGSEATSIAQVLWPIRYGDWDAVPLSPIPITVLTEVLIELLLLFIGTTI